MRRYRRLNESARTYRRLHESGKYEVTFETVAYLADEVFRSAEENDPYKGFLELVNDRMSRSVESVGYECNWSSRDSRLLIDEDVSVSEWTRIIDDLRLKDERYDGWYSDKVTGICFRRTDDDCVEIGYNGSISDIIDFDTHASWKKIADVLNKRISDKDVEEYENELEWEDDPVLGYFFNNLGSGLTEDEIVRYCKFSVDFLKDLSRIRKYF